jgi:hypothetical protein
MAVGATVTIRFRGIVPTTTPVGTTLTDTATVTRNETDTVPANDTDSATITVIAAAPATEVPQSTVQPPAPQAAPPPSGSLASTGENAITPLEAALILLALGAALVAVCRPRSLKSPSNRQNRRATRRDPTADGS